MTPFFWRGDYLHKAQVEEIVCVYFFCRLVFFLNFAMCFLPGPTQHILHTPMALARYSLFVLKVPLNTNRPDQSETNWYENLTQL